MKKRKFNGEPPNLPPATKKRKRMLRVFDNPWKAAKGEGHIKLVDVVDECLEESGPSLTQKPVYNMTCSAASTGDFAWNSTMEKVIHNFRGKLEFANPMSQLSQVSKSPEGRNFLKPHPLGFHNSSLNETLVSLDSQRET